MTIEHRFPIDNYVPLFALAITTMTTEKKTLQGYQIVAKDSSRIQYGRRWAVRMVEHIGGFSLRKGKMRGSDQFQQDAKRCVHAGEEAELIGLRPACEFLPEVWHVKRSLTEYEINTLSTTVP